MFLIILDPVNSGIDFHRYAYVTLQMYSNSLLIISYFGIGIIWLDAILKRNVIHNFSKKVTIAYFSFVGFEAALTNVIMGIGAVNAGDGTDYSGTLDIINGIVIILILLINIVSAQGIRLLSFTTFQIFFVLLLARFLKSNSRSNKTTKIVKQISVFVSVVLIAAILSVIYALLWENIQRAV